MQRAILLQIEPTLSKQKFLSKFEQAATAETNRLLAEREKYKKFNDFWHGNGSESKERTGFNIQIVCDLARSVWSKQKGCTRVDGITVKFNIPRNCKMFKTKGFTFVELGMYPRNRLAVPIRKNRNWDRFSGLLGNGWTCRTFGLTPNLQVVAYVSKADIPIQERKNMLGVDVNSKRLGVTVLSPEGNVLKQTYVGKGIWKRCSTILKRRSLLQSYAAKGSRSAEKKLRKLKRDEHNFRKNKVGEAVRDITNLAVKYDADVTIEKLGNWKPKGKRFNREVFRMPTYLFRMNLTNRCFDKGITLNLVDGYHTSKWCDRCGAVGKGHDPSNYSLFRCKECGQVVNSDRKASLAIAVKSLLERNKPTDHSEFQISSRRVPVSGLIRRPHETGRYQTVPPVLPAMASPLSLDMGSLPSTRTVAGSGESLPSTSVSQTRCRR